MPPPLSPKFRHPVFLLAAAVVASLCALPWWRHHDHLRDFMDYGLVMSAIGRIGAGEKPYTDFITPIQAGFLHLSRGIEAFGGGTYLGLTRGGLALILGATLGLATLLRRRWPAMPALALAGTLVACTAAQHTILWYNPLGVLCLAAAAWAAAIAPTLKARSWRWHLLLAVALTLGGLNKISFQLVALAACSFFALRTAILHPPRRTGALGMLGLVLVAGVALPLGLELTLTGASPAEWSRNVLGLAGPERAAYLRALATWSFYLTPRHDYYGPSLVPQIGAVCVALFLAVAAWGWRHRAALDRVLLLVSTGGFALAALALLATNHEISHVGLGGALALATALALGFELRPAGRGAGLVVALPVAALGLAAGISAWQGQRSQLGHSPASRGSYVAPGDTDPRFHYIAGLKIPPDLAAAFVELGANLPPARADGRHPVLFTAGTEWLDRVWPPVRIAGFPLWYAEGTSAGPREAALLTREIVRPERLRRIYGAVPWDYRAPELDAVLRAHSELPQLRGWFIREYRLRTNLSVPDDPLHRLNDLGCNYDPALLVAAPGCSIQRLGSGRPLFGDVERSASLEFTGLAGRLDARAVVRRIPGAGTARPLRARFRVDLAEGEDWRPFREETTLELASGAERVEAPIPIDCAGRRVRFTVAPEAGMEGCGESGWEAPRIEHGPVDDRPPPRLFANAQDDDATPPTLAAAALISGDWRPEGIVTRGAEIRADGLLLRPGGQVWFRAQTPLASFDGRALTLAAPEGELPVLRLVWVAGDRVQILEQAGLPAPGQAHRFHGWSPGAQGWFGLLIDPNYAVGPVVLRIEATKE